MDGPSSSSPLLPPPPSRWPLWIGLVVLVAGLIGWPFLPWHTATRIKLEFLHQWGDMVAPATQKTFAQFTAQHPEIDLQIIAAHSQWSGDYLLESIRANRMPDVVVLNSKFIPLINPGHNLLPLEPLAQADGLNLGGLFPARELEGLSPGGELRALPLIARSSIAMLLINLDLVEKAGLTNPILRVRNWAEFTEVSRQLVDALNPPGELNIVAWNPLLDRSIPLISALSYGEASVMTPDGRTSLLDQAAIRPAWLAIERYLHEVYDAHGGITALLKWQHHHAGFSSNVSQLSLTQKKCAFSFGGLWTVGIHYRANPAIRLLTRPIPGLHGPMILPAGNPPCIAISRNCANPAAAWKLVRHLALTAESNSQINLASGMLCPLPDFNDLTAYRRIYGSAWDDFIKLSEQMPTPPIWYDPDYIGQLALDYISCRASGEPLEQSIQKVHQAYQAVLDNRPHLGP